MVGAIIELSLTALKLDLDARSDRHGILAPTTPTSGQLTCTDQRDPERDADDNRQYQDDHRIHGGPLHANGTDLIRAPPIVAAPQRSHDQISLDGQL